MRQILRKGKKAARKILCLDDPCTPDPVLSIASHEGSSSTRGRCSIFQLLHFLQFQEVANVQDATLVVKERADPQQALQDAEAAAEGIKSPLGHARDIATAVQDRSADLDAADNVQDTYLRPPEIFDTVIEEIANVHPYAKMALGVLSRASKIILAQADRDNAVLELFKKLAQVYLFMTEDKNFRFLLKPAVLRPISQQTLEYAHFITDYSETKNFWKRLGKNIVSETIQEYHNVLDALMQNFREGSILSGTTNSSTPIQPLHASFCDFLTEPSYNKEFFVDVSKVQRDLTFASLRVMEHGLRFNIGDLKSSYLPNCKDPGLQERVKTHIPLHPSYSSRIWTMHVRTTVFDEELAKEVRLFFNHERPSFWLEPLALTDVLSGAGAALSLIAQWPKGGSAFKDVSSTALDVQRYIQVFGGIILHSTPHLYVSTLPFSPTNSALSGTLSAQFPNTLHVSSGRDINWPAVLAVLRGYDEPVNSFSFSQDGTRIVTGSWDSTVRLWDAVTGQPVGEPLKGHTSSVKSVSFSPDGTRIVTGSHDYTVRPWDVPTRVPLQQCAEPDYSASSYECRVMHHIEGISTSEKSRHSLLIRLYPYTAQHC